VCNWGRVPAPQINPKLSGKVAATPELFIVQIFGIYEKKSVSCTSVATTTQSYSRRRQGNEPPAKPYSQHGIHGLRWCGMKINTLS
jgi:hypothetical protein